jgi:CubicO group peptidase (beta-lactamase class C family)
MRVRLAIVSVVMTLIGCAFGQELGAAEQSKIDQLFSEFTKASSPGCALGVYRNGSIAYAKGYGLASLELQVPITPETVFDIGSTSKQFTAFSILLLQQQGKLSVDDELQKFIPKYPTYGEKITLRHLLNHTSGIRDYNGLMDLAGIPTQNVTDDQDGLDILLRQKALNFNPGEEWDYSNSGFFLLSQVVKRVSGPTLRDFDEEKIFKPLGMTNTVIFNDYAQVVPHRATGYSFDSDKKAFGVEMSNWEQTGDGSVQTSVTDLQKWDENFYTAKVGGPELIKEMQLVGKLNNGEEHGYAAGLMISTYRGQPIVSHGGAWAGYRAELLRFPKQHTSVAVLCNLAQSRPSVRARRVADIVLASVLTPDSKDAQKSASNAAAVTVLPEVLRGYAGVYKDDKNEYLRVAEKDGKLLLASYGLELIPQSQSVFGLKVTDGTVTFTPGVMRLDLQIGKPKIYSRVETSPVGDLSRYVGNYYSPELDAVWLVRLKDGALTARPQHGLGPEMSLEGIREGLFLMKGGTLQFEPAKEGKMRALLSVSRIRNIEFTKVD